MHDQPSNLRQTTILKGLLQLLFKQVYQTISNRRGFCSSGLSNILEVLRTPEYLAVGTCEGNVRVWIRYSSHQKWTAYWTGNCGDVPVICLSFRADGGLLAAGTSLLTDWSTIASSSRQVGTSERVILYETTTWRCVGCLNFKSWLGCCSFYCPAIDLCRRLGTEVTAAWRILLVCTSNGLQAHILPELTGTSPSPKRSTIKSLEWEDVDCEARLSTPLFSI